MEPGSDSLEAVGEKLMGSRLCSTAVQPKQGPRGSATDLRGDNWKNPEGWRPRWVKARIRPSGGEAEHHRLPGRLEQSREIGSVSQMFSLGRDDWMRKTLKPRALNYGVDVKLASSRWRQKEDLERHRERWKIRLGNRAGGMELGSDSWEWLGRSRELEAKERIGTECWELSRAVGKTWRIPVITGTFPQSPSNSSSLTVLATGLLAQGRGTLASCNMELVWRRDQSQGKPDLVEDGCGEEDEKDRGGPLPSFISLGRYALSSHAHLPHTWPFTHLADSPKRSRLIRVEGERKGGERGREGDGDWVEPGARGRGARSMKTGALGAAPQQNREEARGARRHGTKMEAGTSMAGEAEPRSGSLGRRQTSGGLGASSHGR